MAGPRLIVQSENHIKHKLDTPPPPPHPGAPASGIHQKSQRIFSIGKSKHHPIQHQPPLSAGIGSGESPRNESKQNSDTITLSRRSRSSSTYGINSNFEVFPVLGFFWNSNNARSGGSVLRCHPLGDPSSLWAYATPGISSVPTLTTNSRQLNFGWPGSGRRGVNNSGSLPAVAPSPRGLLWLEPAHWSLLPLSGICGRSGALMIKITTNDDIETTPPYCPPARRAISRDGRAPWW